jgi:hypothetical protein
MLDFQAVWSPQALKGNGGNSIETPVACRTESYVAGSGEVAGINMSGTGSPSVQTNDVLYINAMISVNGGVLEVKSPLDAAESLSDGTAHVTSQVRYPLQAGKTYVFGARFPATTR